MCIPETNNLIFNAIVERLLRLDREDLDYQELLDELTDYINNCYGLTIADYSLIAMSSLEDNITFLTELVEDWS